MYNFNSALKKFVIMFRPDTLQLAYQNMENLEVVPNILNFNDGSVRVDIPLDVSFPHRYCVISAVIESLDDLMIVAQIKEIIDRIEPNKSISLVLHGTAYTRYDRVMFEDKSDAFGAKVFADFINSIGFDFVYFNDPHSKVITDLVTRSVIVDQKYLLRATVPNLKEFGIICPDAGARSKLGDDASLYFSKQRSVKTGKIDGVVLAEINLERNVNKLLIVDDICEGGGTFIGIANAIKESYHYDRIFKDKELNLYVTHGIFSRNAIPRLLEHFANIYVYSMKESVYNALTESEKSRVIYNTLFV